MFIFFLKQVREFDGQPGWFRRSMGAVHKGVLHSLQSSYTYFSPGLQRGPLNPSILRCTDPFLPQSISWHHPQLSTPSPSPGSRSSHPYKHLLATGKDQARAGWVAYHALPYQSHKHHCYSPDFLCRAAGASGDGDKGFGLLTHFKQPILLPLVHTVGVVQHRLHTCPRGLVVVCKVLCACG